MRKQTRKALRLWLLTGLFLLLFGLHPFAGSRKRIAILGDSYSSCFGTIPKGYAPSYAYKKKNGKIKWKRDVKSAGQMWWYKLVKTGQYRLAINCSYSGSCFGYTCKGGLKKNPSSYISRMKEYLNGKKVKADIIFVEGGTNDTWKKRLTGKLQYGKRTRKSLSKALPAFCYILRYLKKKYPKARIVVLINDKYIRDDLVRGMIKACGHYRLKYLLLGNISMQSRHPDKKGQAQIYRQVLSFLEN